MPSTSRLPGTRLFRWAADWFEPATVSRVFEPLVADWQHEWLAATTWHGRAAVPLRGQLAFFGSAGRMVPALLMSPLPSGLTAAVVTRVTVFVGAASLLMMAPFVREWSGDVAPPALWLMMWYLLPSTITFALPFAVIGAVDLLRSRLPASDARGRRAALQMALIAVVAMVLASGWWVADSNQQWREFMAHRVGASLPVVRGVREQTIADLFRQSPMPLGEINSRITLMLLPVILVAMRWKALGRRGTASGTGVRFELGWALAVLSALTIVRFSSEAVGFPVGLPFPGLLLVAAMTLTPWVLVVSTSAFVSLARRLHLGALGAPRERG